MSDKEAKKTLPLPESGLLRLRTFVGRGKVIPVAPSTWWAGVKSGRYPQPVKLGPRITAWQAQDIQALMECGVAGDGPKSPKGVANSARDNKCPRAADGKPQQAEHQNDDEPESKTPATERKARLTTTSK